MPLVATRDDLMRKIRRFWCVYDTELGVDEERKGRGEVMNDIAWWRALFSLSALSAVSGDLVS